MTSYLDLALVAGFAIASVNAYFARRDGRDAVGTLRSFVAWLLAFVVAGLVAEPVAVWLLTNVF